MKILLVSMNSLHFRRWTFQLENSGHDVYWFDIKDQGYIPSLSWVHQIVGWKKGFLKRRGRTFLKKQLPNLYQKLSDRFDINVEVAFTRALEEIKPDLVHSFALYISCTPILFVMNKKPELKWLYSSWGSDLFYFQNIPEYLDDIKMVLQRVTHIITDCNRDAIIVKKYGFSGEHLGVFPGGGGFNLKKMKKWRCPFLDRDVILVKGYQGRSGRAIQVIKALEKVSEQTKEYQIVIFGADLEVKKYIEDNKFNARVFLMLPRNEVLKLMGKSFLFIGNSNSDGMPNTLLEAICMGSFPIQSNPGGASSEIIENRKNGFLIGDSEDVNEIALLISSALASENKKLLFRGAKHNIRISNSFSYDKIKVEIQKCYSRIESVLN